MFLQRAAIGSLPGEFMFTFGIIFNLVVLIFAFATVRLKEATGEVLPDHDFTFHPLRRVTTTLSRAAKPRSATERRTKRARQRTRTTRPGTTGSLAGHTGSLTRDTGSLSGEWKRPDTGDLQRADREPLTEETLI